MKYPFWVGNWLQIVPALGKVGSNEVLFQKALPAGFLMRTIFFDSSPSNTSIAVFPTHLPSWCSCLCFSLKLSYLLTLQCNVRCCDNGFRCPHPVFCFYFCLFVYFCILTWNNVLTHRNDSNDRNLGFLFIHSLLCSSSFWSLVQQIFIECQLCTRQCAKTGNATVNKRIMA